MFTIRVINLERSLCTGVLDLYRSGALVQTAGQMSSNTFVRLGRNWACCALTRRWNDAHLSDWYNLDILRQLRKRNKS